ncbi:unnamed protein product [Adineta steineri]|uniref:NHL repeat containing protein n=1 Tax=Adineta steineri TaxID=433720 RepID=A0A816FE87_9BILA|nr:unnamed protein product [Adineta steineri]CAF1660407.1 unnamed protein product [Adineta steineri]
MVTQGSKSPAMEHDKGCRQLPQASAKMTNKGASRCLTGPKIVLMVVGIIGLLIVVVAVPIIVSDLKKDNNSNCAPNGLQWNTTGITVLSSSQLTHISGLYIDSNDTLYTVDEYSNGVVWKVPKNTLTPILVAGILQSAGSNASQFNYPQDVYVDSQSNVYVTDLNNNRVQKFVNQSTTGQTIAGISGSSGVALNQFNGLRYFTFDPTETYMYITDYNNHRIMRYLTNATTGDSGTLVAGGGNGAGNNNNQLNSPWGIYYLPSVSNYMYITNYDGNTLMRWIPGASSGELIAGIPNLTGSSSSLLSNPMGVKIDIYQNVFVVDRNNNRVQMFCPNSSIGITIAGNVVSGSAATQLNGPRGIAFDSSMNMYITDYSNYRIQKFNKL